MRDYCEQDFTLSDAIERGQELKPEIESAIVGSRASIVALSENYAKSRWCLDELSLILEQRKNQNHFVLPVFCHVDPSDVRNQTQSFAIEGSKCSSGAWAPNLLVRALPCDREVMGSSPARGNLKDIQVREGILSLISGSGPMGARVYLFHGVPAHLVWPRLTSARWALLRQHTWSESDFIAKVVHTINCKLDLRQLSTPAHLTGMEAQAAVISSWLKDEQSNANVLAICGMGGACCTVSEVLCRKSTSS
ncbi:hypothetical protein R6Q59_016380 [Mikania micrantha]